MKRAAFLALAVALSACAQAPTAGSAFYRPKGADDQLNITGTISGANAFRSARTVTVMINGQAVAEGDSNASFSGTWAGRRIEAACHHTGGPFTGITGAALTLAGADSPGATCLVFVDGERAASFNLARQ